MNCARQSAAEDALPTADPLDPEFVALFDRFLHVVAAADRRHGGRFVFRHLRRRLRAFLRGRGADVVVEDHGRFVGRLAVVLADGDLERHETHAPTALTWRIEKSLIERVALEPWGFLARPDRLGFAWFVEPDAR